MADLFGNVQVSDSYTKYYLKDKNGNVIGYRLKDNNGTIIDFKEQSKNGKARISSNGIENLTGAKIIFGESSNDIKFRAFNVNGCKDCTIDASKNNTLDDILVGDGINGGPKSSNNTIILGDKDTGMFLGGHNMLRAFVNGMVGLLKLDNNGIMAHKPGIYNENDFLY